MQHANKERKSCEKILENYFLFLRIGPLTVLPKKNQNKMYILKIIICWTMTYKYTYYLLPIVIEK